MKNELEPKRKKIKREFSLPSEIIILIIEYSACNTKILTKFSLINNQFHSIIYDSSYGLWDHLLVRYPFRMNPPNLSIIKKIYFDLEEDDEVDVKFTRVQEFTFKNDSKECITLIVNCINSEQISKVTFFGETRPSLVNYLIDHFSNLRELVLNDFDFQEWDGEYDFSFKQTPLLESFVFVEETDEYSGCYNEPNDTNFFFNVFTKYSFSNLQKIWFEPYYSNIELFKFVEQIKHLNSLKHLQVTLSLWDFTPIPSYATLPPLIEEIQFKCAFKVFAKFLIAYFNHPKVYIQFSPSEHFLGDTSIQFMTTDELIEELIMDKERKEELKSLINEKRYLGKIECMDKSYSGSE
ncbi:predicted protein [Naegleria gruberi]|uniref:Predicted protein n=1 Tax=Naegleria gruberi TaxID=5762 RepID=D2V5V7_NAEGR|nr:uncharacterized protein NAEGRDRAFT_64218 [Naegleria gruberi]EFC47718.1 predicted protein [Naegleria gruberi]|eukprot:XP_002680462.1 predicted protein [Naegleria gruberi strain NEG-M]